jgi:predicted  nucleic acid-binding Zn-ribbon protein
MSEPTIEHECVTCGEKFTLPRDVTLTRGSRPCGWSH